MSLSIDEKTAARLESTHARARALLGARIAPGDGTNAESTEGGARPVGPADARLIAARIRQHSSIDAAAATSIADDIVGRASAALAKLAQSHTGAALSDEDAIALESVIHVRGRPAIRVLTHGLESLERHPGSELWQDFIADYEDRIVAAAAVTGAAIVSAFATGNPPWVQGSAWLVAGDRVVTNRHVLVPPDGDEPLIEAVPNGAGMRLRNGYTVTIEFAADDRTPSAKIRRRVTRVLYVAKPDDPVDVAVLAIETCDAKPLLLAANAGTPNNLFVVGHPALMANIPDEVKAVFGNPDGRKRVSFGKRLEGVASSGDIAHDASTVGGYSGGPVVGISDGAVAGLHYFGDPVAGNLAVTAAAIMAHAAYQYMATPLQ